MASMHRWKIWKQSMTMVALGNAALDYAVHAVREVHRNFLHGIALVFRKLEQRPSLLRLNQYP